MTFPLPTFTPEPDNPDLCETYLHGRLIRADSPELLAQAIGEALLGPLPESAQPGKSVYYGRAA